jgi:N-acetyltransferase 10
MPGMSKEEADRYFNSYDIKRLEQYAMNLVDYHLVVDLVPQIARLYFTNQLGPEFSLSLVQSAILIGMGLEHKSIEDLEKELQLPPNQMLALFNKIVKKVISLLEEISVKEMSQLMFKERSAADKASLDNKMQPLAQSLEEELNEAASKVKAKEAAQKKQLLDMKLDLKQYEIKGTENEWTDALKLPATSSYVTVKR